MITIPPSPMTTRSHPAEAATLPPPLHEGLCPPAPDPPRTAQRSVAEGRGAWSVTQARGGVTPRPHRGADLESCFSLGNDRPARAAARTA